MPEQAKVTLQYGPYEACAVVEHRDSRLEGLQAVLTDEGHQVTLEKIKDWNVVNLVVNGEQVFTCRQTDLDYGGDGKLDQLCADASHCVHIAY